MENDMHRTFAFLAGALLSLGLIATARSCAGEAAAAFPTADEPPAVILVELFTSQGCSSCPPADRLLSELEEIVGPDVEVLPLAFHVDYWNRLGWRDPFSSPRWSERQSLYARAFDASRIYTPQLVIGGVFETVGSDRRSVLALIERARLENERRAEIEVTARLTGGVLAVEAKVGGGLSSAAELWVAVAENGLATEVARGENAHRSLANDHVVRRLEKLAEVEPGGREPGARELLELEDGWRRDRLEVVVFLQDPSSFAILGAARTRPSP